MSPTLSKVDSAATLVMVNAGALTAVTVSSSVLESVPFADAFAVFFTDPASRSACVIVYDAVHVIDAPGTRPPAGQVTVALSSATVTGPANDTLPVFVTR